MAQKRKRKNKKHIYTVVVLILLLVAGVVTYCVWNAYFNKKADEIREQETSVENEGDKKDEIKKDINMNEEDGEVETEKEKEKVMAYEGDNPNKAGELTGVVTYAGVSPDGGELVIRVNIDQYLGDGSCELDLVQNGVAYTDTASITASASTATCEGFNVSTGGLGGDYDIVIYLSSGGRMGVIKGEVSI